MHETPFRLTFKADAMILMELEESSPRTTFSSRTIMRMRATTNKLTPNWEGSFRVGQGAFKLEHLDERSVLRTWNIATLRKYYS
ncbi:hypothetical protein CR513_05412, partial [Mucuna pruriens]